MSVEIPKFSGSESSEPEKKPGESAISESPPDESRLRGKLIEDLRAREKQEEETTSRLRGDLLKAIHGEAESATPGSASEPSRLRGTLLEAAKNDTEQPSTEEPSRLRGTLLKKMETPEALERYSHDWLRAQTFYRSNYKPGAENYRVGAINPSRAGGYVIKLVNIIENSSVTLNLENFVQRLQSGDPIWSVKE